jgi:hypothetical protein
MKLRRNRSTFSAAIAPLLAGAVAAGLTLLTPSDAKAGLALGADLALPVPVDNIAGAGTGMTLEGRLGWQFGLMIFDITPELKGGYSRISTPGGGAGVARGLAGGRLGLGGPLQPGVFVHLGYGTVTDIGQAAFCYDVGAFLDFKFSIFAAGVHGAWNELTLSPGTFKTFDVGIHANIVF